MVVGSGVYVPIADDMAIETWPPVSNTISHDIPKVAVEVMRNGLTRLCVGAARRASSSSSQPDCFLGHAMVAPGNAIDTGIALPACALASLALTIRGACTAQPAERATRRRRLCCPAVGPAAFPADVEKAPGRWIVSVSTIITTISTTSYSGAPAPKMPASHPDHLPAQQIHGIFSLEGEIKGAWYFKISLVLGMIRTPQVAAAISGIIFAAKNSRQLLAAIEINETREMVIVAQLCLHFPAGLEKLGD